jgi:hypothetical protein
MKVDFSKVKPGDTLYVKSKFVDIFEQTIKVRFEDEPRGHAVYKHEVVAHIPTIESWEDIRDKLKEIQIKWAYDTPRGPNQLADRIIALLNEVDPK